MAISKTVLAELTAVLFVVLVFLPFLNATGQISTTFTSDNWFTIPQSNGAIRFSGNVSYSAASLENNVWYFKDLRFNVSQPSIGSLKISAANSNVTIVSYRVFNVSLTTERLFYFVEGEGNQTVNLCLSKRSSLNEWTINLDGQSFVSEGHGWKLLPEDTLLISGAKSSASIVHYNYVNTDDLPFFEQHSVAIVTGAVLGFTAIAAALINFKRRR